MPTTEDNIHEIFMLPEHEGRRANMRVSRFIQNYSGDVLNTTSRIQGECNHNNADLLLSSDLPDRMQLNGEYQQIDLGEISLKGKKEKISLYAIRVA